MGAQPSTDSNTLFTFQVDDVKISKEQPCLTTADSIIKKQCGIKGKLEDFSHRENKHETFIADDVPGLILALHTAYNYHYPLKLSVSDFILLIGQGLGKHIDNNAEKLRKYFVNHEGKEKIQIRRDEFVMGNQNDWSTVFGEFAEEIKKRVKADVHGVVIDDTSVATPISRIASEITLMDCMKNYFSYEVMTMCGIPQITLEGSASDWEKLREKVRKLIEMNKGNCLELDWWLEKLEPIVNKICDTAITKKADKEFWSGIYKYQNPGSGSPKISGWITTFIPYIAGGANKHFYSITTGKIPKQICEVPFIWNYYGKEIEMTFCGGFLGASFDKETSTVQPAHFWSVAYKGNDEEGNDKESNDEERRRLILLLSNTSNSNTY